jgi:hypothetical protein
MKAHSFIPSRDLFVIGQLMHIYVLLSSIKMPKSEYSAFESQSFLEWTPFSSVWRIYNSRYDI